MPAITRITARIHSRVTMTALPTCTGAPSAPCRVVNDHPGGVRNQGATGGGAADRPAAHRTSCAGPAGTPQVLYPAAPVSGRERGVAVPQQLDAALLLVDLPYRLRRLRQF